MRLTAIKLAGFKSFVDPTSLPLPSNLTGVVGPNGCGKSNLIDAVRWVLGETSIKNLRGADSEDVIFNGSKSRKPVGRASVELVFDNSDQQIVGPYAAYTDISVKRELTRDGNSQYYLNGKKCLKRDVTDLFLGTGLGGKNQYAIIEQGMVSRMVEAKPDELRQWLEEAAGISKYKERRRETESRIKQTRENLARLGDLRGELGARLEALGKQAANAEKFKEFKAQERQLRAEILVLRLAALEQQRSATLTKIAAEEAAFEAAKRAVVDSYAARQNAEAAFKAEQEKLNAEQAQVYEAEAALARQEQALKHARELQSLKARELEQLSRQLAELQQREQREQQRLLSLNADVAALEQQVQAAETAEGDALAAVSKAEAEAQSEQQKWNEHLARAEAPLSQVEAERVRVQQLDRARLMLDERIKRLGGEQATLDVAPIQTSLSDCDTELSSLQTELAEATARLQQVDQELTGQRDARAALEKNLHEDRQSLQSARGRLASLETLQQAAMRQDDAELNQWLRAQGLSEAPRLAAQLSVDGGWEAAVEHVLGGLLQAPLTPTYADPTGAPKAGIALLDATPGVPPGDADRLSHHLRGPAAVLEFLHGVFVAPTAEAARGRAETLLAGESVVTPDGVWRGRGWVRHPKTGDAQSGVLARAQLLKQLKAQVDALASRVAEQEQTLNALRSQAQALEAERREQAAKVEQRRQRASQRQAFRQAQQVRLEQVQSRLAALSQELQTLNAQQAQQTQELAASREQLVQLEATAARLRQERVELQQSQARARDQVNRVRAVLTQAAQARNAVQLRLAGQKSAVTALQQGLQDLAARVAAQAQAKAEHEAQAGELDAPVTETASEVEGARAAVAARREQLRLARERLGATEVALSQAQEAARGAEFAQDAAREALQASRLDAEGDKAREAGLLEQVGETGFELEGLRAGLPADAAAEAWEEKLASMLRRIDRLGAINLAAIQELEEAQQRANYLDEQNGDLTGALDTLEEAMRQIDAETRDLFKQTFDTVNTVFMDRFPKLFGGGEAYLELTGDNLLDTGVRVMARPPGKRNSTIQLLSGGEKAMTAVALLLALFQLNPAPFCLMDEVDAPLDDANVGRFCEIVREMSQGVQFIIITHNKITMELANQLHGVTMQEPGVSRLVSVDVAQAVELTGTELPQENAR
ncbi:MAG: chromosome segregation protein SMC [Stagnimonas sp.]|nr:chromosome segregation protein SMC [Stagnimonas sp.]